MKRYNLTEKNVSFTSDNTNANFDGQERNGQKNIYFHLKQYRKEQLIGGGCRAHLLNNAIQYGFDRLPIDRVHNYENT